MVQSRGTSFVVGGNRPLISEKEGFEKQREGYLVPNVSQSATMYCLFSHPRVNLLIRNEFRLLEMQLAEDGSIFIRI